MSPDNEKKIPPRVWLETHTQKELGFSSGLTLQPGANWWETPALFQWLWGVAVGRVTCMCKCVTMVPKPGGCVVDHSCCADWFGKLGPKRMHFDTRQTKTEIATIKKKKSIVEPLSCRASLKTCPVYQESPWPRNTGDIFSLNSDNNKMTIRTLFEHKIAQRSLISKGTRRSIYNPQGVANLGF